MNPKRIAWRPWVQHIRAFAAAPHTGFEAKALFALLMLFLLVISLLNVVNSYVGRNFFTAIEQRQSTDYLHYAALWMAVFAGSTFFTVMHKFFEDRLALLWRKWTTSEALGRYLRGRSYQKLVTKGEIENPDQRIAEDIRSFTAGTLSFALMLFNGTITIVAFSAVLWSISPLLFCVGVAYAATGTYITVRLGLPLVGLNFRQLDKEANFRAVLVHVRENAAPLALAQREDYLASRLRSRLTELTDNYREIVSVQRTVGFFTTGYNWMIQIIPALMVAPLFINGEVRFGVITQAAVAFGHLLGAFSLIVTQFQSLSSFAAVVTRLDSLFRALDETPAVTPTTALSTVVMDDRVSYERLSLRSVRRQRILTENLNLTIIRGQHTLVRGPDNAARFALLRATAGVWNSGTGRIGRPALDQIMFLAERPYLPPSTLHDIMLPAASVEPAATEREISDILQALGADNLVTRAGGFGHEQQWESLFTLNDQQLLVCARLVLLAPRFAFLEHPAATLEPPQIARLLPLLKARDITYVVFDKEVTDPHAYEQVLDLEPGGGWSSFAVTPMRGATE